MGLCDPYDRKWRHQNCNRIHLVEITTFLIMDENITFGRTHGRAEGKSDLRSMKLHLNPFYEVIHQKTSILTDWGREGRWGGQLLDRWAGVQKDGQTDKETGIGRKKYRPTDPPISDGVTHKDDSLNLFDQLQSSPSRDAVDDQFQRTPDVPIGIKLE